MNSYKVHGFIYKIGVNRCIDIPRDISKKMGDENYIPVKISVRGFTKRTNLIPSGLRYHRLFLDSEIRTIAMKDTGEFIELEIERDDEPRKIVVPEELKTIFEENKTAKVVFENMTINQKREITHFINTAKNLETKENRALKVVAVLTKESQKRKRK